jgi:hypothetical protein
VGLNCQDLSLGVSSYTKDSLRVLLISSAHDVVRVSFLEASSSPLSALVTQFTLRRKYPTKMTCLVVWIMLLFHESLF